MKIKFVTEDTLAEIKANYEIVYKDVIRDKTFTMQQFFKNDRLIKESGIEAEDFTLDMSSENPRTTDVENIKRVFLHMNLSESQASDERIWVAYAFSEFVDYMNYRWKPEDAIAMMNRYTFNYPAHRSLFRNGIARLWWIGKVTYDAKRDNPFELAAFVCRDQDYINQLLDIGFGNNTKIVHSVIAALADAEKAGANVDREAVRKISQYVNLLGGTYIIDALDCKWIYGKVYNKLLSN